MANHLNKTLLIFAALSTLNLPVSALDNSICPVMGKSQNMPESALGSFKTRENFCDSNQKSYTSYLHIYPDGLLAVTSDSRPLVLSDEEINALPVKTTADLESAQLTALSYELMAEYKAGEKLYQHMLNAITKSPSDNEAIRDDLLSSLSRIKMWEDTDLYEYDNDYNKAALTYRQILLTISSNQNIELENKLKLVSTVIHKLSNTTHAKYTKKVYYQAQQLHDLYTKQSTCLQIAADLDRTAWRLERVGLYDRAEKAYKQLLAIEEKNLGKDNQNTLAARADLARLYADEQRYSQAQNIYERTLALYKKTANRGQPYIALLENYGDMLNHINQTAKANEIYNEAKITCFKL